MTTMTDTLVIPPDVRLVPVLELPEPIRDQIDWSEGDVAVTRLRSRTPSKIVNADFATLFNEFQAGKTIVEAIMHYSLTQAADPQATLENSFPLLQQFVKNGLLTAPELADQASDIPLQRGDQVDDFVIVRCIRTLEDSEIYQAKTAVGDTVALKIKRPDANQLIDHVLQHEAEILRQLNGQFAPCLISQGEWAERPYLAMEWCIGSDVMQVANDLQNQRGELLDLCLAVLTAYADLHKKDVVHGDIHPGNILVDDKGQVTLIDFGLAHTPTFLAPYRGGVPFYYEPEYAAVFLSKQHPPTANPTGEQYALAALLYQMITMNAYVNFSLEEDVLYHQILEEPPLPFSEHGIEAWPEVEAVLGRALAKNPDERFQSVAEFLDVLQRVRQAYNGAGATAVSHQSSPKTPSLLDEILYQLQLDSSLLRDGLPRQPYASINYGTAGIAYALYRIACIRHDPELLTLADVWLTRAEQAAGDENGFYNAELDMAVENIGHISPYHTFSGICATRFLIARAMGDIHSQLAALSEFVASASQPCENLDITLGKAGVILISALLYEALTDQQWAEQSGLLSLGNTLLTDLWEIIDDHSTIGPDCQLTNLGIAHGWAGLLFATLRWHEATNSDLPGNLTTRLNELASLAEETGRGCRWLWEFGQGEASMSGWCNGSAGYVYLWSLAYRLFGNLAYRQLAVRVGWHAWEDSAEIGNLCCGLAGRSYSLAHLYQLTNDQKWLERSQTLAKRAAYHIRHSQPTDYDGFEMSLYKGELAVALLLADLEQPHSAVFPFFSREISQ